MHRFVVAAVFVALVATTTTGATTTEERPAGGLNRERALMRQARTRAGRKSLGRSRSRTSSWPANHAIQAGTTDLATACVAGGVATSRCAVPLRTQVDWPVVAVRASYPTRQHTPSRR